MTVAIVAFIEDGFVPVIQDSDDDDDDEGAGYLNAPQISVEEMLQDLTI